MHKRLLAAPAHHEGEQHISGKLDFGKIFWKCWKTQSVFDKLLLFERGRCDLDTNN